MKKTKKKIKNYIKNRGEGGVVAKGAKFLPRKEKNVVRGDTKDI